ncbi:MAG: 30S ribosomal protein S3 [Peptostreptococcales bacterium]
MGQKVNPHGLRVGVIKDWESKWYANKKNFADLLVEDNKLRDFINEKLKDSSISRIRIERAANNKVKITIHTAKPGMVIGKGGTGIDQLRLQLEKLVNKSVILNIIEIKRPELDAKLVAESIAFSLERRVSFRRAMKQAMGRTMKSGAKGIKVMTAGRLGGAEMARNEKYSEGNVPLHTLRADIDYGVAEANTTYGKIGVKVWINKGEILSKTLTDAAEEPKMAMNDNKNRGNRPRRRPDNSKRRETRKVTDKQ